MERSRSRSFSTVSLSSDEEIRLEDYTILDEVRSTERNWRFKQEAPKPISERLGWMEGNERSEDRNWRFRTEAPKAENRKLAERQVLS